VVFLHVAADEPDTYRPGLAEGRLDGNQLGETLARYTLEFSDGTHHERPILRRFSVQQGTISWGASPFAAVPGLQERVFASADETVRLQRLPGREYGRGETRHGSGRDRAWQDRHVWLYALPNPEPGREISRLVLHGTTTPVAIYGISTTSLEEHPLRPTTCGSPCRRERR